MALQASRPDPEALAATRARMAAQIERERRAVEAAGGAGAGMHGEPTGTVVVQVGAGGAVGACGANTQHGLHGTLMRAVKLTPNSALASGAPADRWICPRVRCTCLS